MKTLNQALGIRKPRPTAVATPMSVRRFYGAEINTTEGFFTVVKAGQIMEESTPDTVYLKLMCVPK